VARELLALLFPVSELAPIKPIELKSHSRRPVSQGVARSGTAEWHPYRNSIRINAPNAEPRTSWLLQSSTSRERAHILVRSIRVRASPIRPSPLRHQFLAVRSPSSALGDADVLYVLLGLCRPWRILGHPESATRLGDTVVVFLLLGAASFAGMLLNFHRIARYNRQVYPNSVGTGNTPTFAGAAGSSALYLHS